MSISSDSSDNEDETPHKNNNKSPKQPKTNENNKINNLKETSENSNNKDQNNKKDNSENNNKDQNNKKDNSENNNKDQNNKSQNNKKDNSEKSKEDSKNKDKKQSDLERRVRKLLPIVPMTDFKCAKCLRFVSTINNDNLCLSCSENKKKKEQRQKRFYPDKKLPKENTYDKRQSRFYNNPCYNTTKNNLDESNNTSSSLNKDVTNTNKDRSKDNKNKSNSKNSNKRLEDKRPKLLIFEINNKINNDKNKDNTRKEEEEEDEEEKKRDKKRSKSEDDRNNYYLDDDNWKKLEDDKNNTVYEKNYNSIDEMMNDEPFMELLLRIEAERRRMMNDELKERDEYNPDEEYNDVNPDENPERAPLIFYPHRKTSNKQDEDDSNKTDDTNEEEIEYEYQWLGSQVNELKDLLKVIQNHKDTLKNTKKRKRYNLNIKQLLKLEEPLLELQKMIGLKTVKQNIFDQIIYYLQGLDNKNTDMLHTVIQGPPGVGKTHLSHIIAKIYKALGFLKSDKVVSVKRDDLIAGYLGQTAIKTRKKIKEALGGVLFIDEAYSLGDKEGRDSFSKEAIDVLTAYLSEHPHDLVCIIAGYKKALKERFFSQNEGLERRFTQRFNIDEYEPADLRLIFFKIIIDNEWEIENPDQIPDSFFETNKDYFIFNGGDMLTLFGCCKKAHAKRLMLIEEEEKLKESKKKINLQDVENGMLIFLTNPEHAERCDNSQTITPFGMYL